MLGKDKENINVLYVDDEVNNLRSFKATFRREFKVYIAESAKEGLEILEEKDVEIIISDQRMPEMTGVEFFEKLTEENPDPIRILLTGYSDIDAVIGAINKGRVYHYITKPWDERYLRNIINNSFEIFRLRAENKRLMEELKLSNEQLEFMIRQHLLS
jgi:response regulator RpfG family c-di-GMP phosphodiesterase